MMIYALSQWLIARNPSLLMINGNPSEETAASRAVEQVCIYTIHCKFLTLAFSVIIMYHIISCFDSRWLQFHSHSSR